jgi:hypothetical protein
VAGSAAQVYERELVPAIFQPWAPRVLALAAPAASERVLDAACGTGVVARLAAERVGPDGRPCSTSPPPPYSPLGPRGSKP